MNIVGNILKYTFGVIVDHRTYANVGYCLIAFPLGLAYFIFLVTGLSVGLGTIVVWVGLPILFIVFLVSWAMTAFERRLSSLMLGVEMEPATVEDRLPAESGWRGLWNKSKAHLGNPATWTGILYLIVKFPVGTFTFTATVTLLSVSVSFILAPLFAKISDPLEITVWTGNVYTFWPVDAMGGAWVVAIVGIALLIISFHLINGMAQWSGQLARAMLKR